MLKILLPIDGSERSKQSMEWIKKRFLPSDIQVTLLFVREDKDDLRSADAYALAKEEVMPMLQQNAQTLKDYTVDLQVRIGRAGEEILTFAEDNKIDTIVMTKSTKTGWVRMIGSVTTHVVKYANCVVVIVPESKHLEP